jgi:hypothetical protein
MCLKRLLLGVNLLICTYSMNPSPLIAIHILLDIFVLVHCYENFSWHCRDSIGNPRISNSGQVR